MELTDLGLDRALAERATCGLDRNEMSYVDKRRKDKAFGKMVRSVLKDKRK